MIWPDFAPEYITPTPQEVLEVLRDGMRQENAANPYYDDGARLGLNTTIADWLEMIDPDYLTTTKRLGRGLNARWKLTESDVIWLTVLEPLDRRTMADLCTFLAARVRLPQARPASVLGRPCLEAGVFLTIRSLLERDGVDVSSVAPSTPLHEYTRRHPHVFFNSVFALAPGALPAARVRAPWGAACTLLLGLAMLSLLLAIWFPWTTVGLVFAGLFGVGYAGDWLAAKYEIPREVKFGELTSFRDLAAAIAQAIRERQSVNAAIS